jgi:transposase-like protein
LVPVSYYDMIKASDHTYSTRMAMVLHAQTHGIRATVRAMGCSRNTVRLWLRMFRAEGRQGLHPKSCAPKTCPHKTSAADEAAVIRTRERVPCFGPRRCMTFPTTGRK